MGVFLTQNPLLASLGILTAGGGLEGFATVGGLTEALGFHFSAIRSQEVAPGRSCIFSQGGPDPEAGGQCQHALAACISYAHPFWALPAAVLP